MSDTFLFRVAAVWPLPGLGLLALPAADEPRLRAYPLHTPLRIEARLPNGRCLPATATVEEISRADELRYGLLLEFAENVTVPVHTEIWLPKYPLAADGFYAGLADSA